jgi:N-acetyl-beta-hexosaminidase
MVLGSCRLLHLGRYRSEKNGCPTTTNIGAERIMAGDPVALKAAKKANKKYKQGKVFNY